MNAIPSSDKAIIRELAKQVAQLAALPVMEENKKLWQALNALKPQRPMVMADQICWNEINVNDDLTLKCQHPDARLHETELRRVIYRQKYMPDDSVVESFVRVPKAVTGMSLGLRENTEIAITDAENSVRSYHYENQITSMEDVEKIKMPTIGHDKAETARRMEIAHELFDGILGIHEEGHNLHISVWDPITTFMGMENALYAMVDEPEMMLALVNRMVAAKISILEQLEEQGLLCGPQPLVHCTGAWTDELPQPGYNPAKPQAKDIWAYGLAQMLGTVSPDMYYEFEIKPCTPLLEKFGLIYYGCCEPLHGKIGVISKIKNIRKLSVSPWASEERLGEEIGGNYVFSRKPNPSLLAEVGFDEDMIRAGLTKTRDICKQNGCPLEFIQKDISTVRYKPERLWKWVQIAKEVAMS